MYRFTIERIDWLTPRIMALTLRYASGERKLLAFHPGQYAAIAFSRHHRVSHTRCFSIASAPDNADTVQFGIRVGGEFTTALSKASPGDTVYVRGPFGGFVFDPAFHEEAIFAAGGIGITPFMSMLRHLSVIGYSHSIHLLYGVQSQDDIPFVDELRHIQQTMPSLRVTYAISHGTAEKLQGSHIVEGHVDGALLHEALEGRPTEKSVFICGPPPFMNSLVEAARVRGVPSGSIITEAFKQGPNRQTGKVVSWPRNMYILGGVGVAVGAFVISVSDIIKNLPTSTMTQETSAQRELRGTIARSNDLDTLVNTFPAADDTAKADSPAVSTALQTATVASAPTTSTGSSTSTSTSTKTSTSTASPTSTKTTTAPAPTPRVPVCTTSQSGVTTCV